MKKINFIFYFLLAGLFLFQSCSLEKRRYKSGYYLHHSSTISKKSRSQENSEKNTIALKQLKEALDVSAIKEKETKKSLLASSDKKNFSVLNFTPRILPTAGDSCDTLVLKNGVQILSKVIEITPRLIRYKHCNNPDGPVYNLAINEVSQIVYKNGNKDVFRAEKEQHTASSYQKSTNTGNGLSNEVVVRRKAKIGLVFGWLSIPLLIFYLAGIAFAIIAISYGIKVNRLMREDPSLFNPLYKKKATTGMVLGIIAILLVTLLIVVLVAASMGIII